MEFFKKYRPRTLSDVVGQSEAVTMIRKMLEKNRLPHAMLFSGGSGVGKTTTARVLVRKLGCVESLGCQEINCAKDGSIDMVRSTEKSIQFKPMDGKPRVWIMDEFQSLSRAGFAQQSMLKMLEEPGEHDYFFLCATDTDKIIPAIKTRCTHIALRALRPDEVAALLTDVAKKESIKLTEAVCDAIVEQASGSAREALVLLGQIAEVPTEKEQLTVVGMGIEGKKQAIDLCRLLMKPGVKWAEIATLIKSIEEEPETVRRIMLGYCSSVLLGGGAAANRAAAIINATRDHWFDCGKAGLVISCYELFGRK